MAAISQSLQKNLIFRLSPPKVSASPRDLPLRKTGKRWWMPLLLLLATIVAVNAGDFIYMINSDGTLTITGYNGPGGDVVIPSVIDGRTVSSIGDNAFWNIFRLKSVIIPDSVTFIGNEAFAYSGLTNVTIGAGVTSIGDYVFYFCTSLTTITVDPSNSVYYAVDSVLFHKNPTTLIQYPLGKAGSSYSIPSGVVNIEKYSFYNCSDLTSVTIPDSVIDIGDWAFAVDIFEDSSLASVTIGTGVKNIGNHAFYYCSNLKSVTIPDSVTRIGYYAFAADAWGSSLASVTIGAGVTSIGDYVFYFCTSLIEITVDPGNSVYSTVEGVLFNKNQTTLIQYPAGKAGNTYTIPGSVTNIDQGAFVRTSLTSMVIPDSVIRIGDEAFYLCKSLMSVMIPDSVTSIGEAAFWHTSLASVAIPDSIIRIGDEAFYFIESLISVTIGKNVTRIGNNAFGYCEKLIGVYFMGNAPSIGEDVFWIDDLTTVYYLPWTTGWGWTFGGRPAMPWWDGPQISANGTREDVTLNRGEAVQITVALDAGNYEGNPLDWWIIAWANDKLFYLNNSKQWTQFDGKFANCRPVYQGRLSTLPATEILNTTDLQSGSYTFWFAIDYPMDGILKFGGYILIDSVNVIVQ